MLDSLHIIASKRLGGAERFFIRLVESLNENGHEAGAVVRPAGMIANTLNNSTRQIHIGMNNNYDLFSALRLRSCIKRERPPIVQTYMGRATRLTRVTPGKGIVHIARLGGFYNIHGYYGHAHAWIGNTKGICDYLVREGLPADRVFLIGNFVDVMKSTPPDQQKDLRRSCKIPDDAVMIFSLARFIQKKGINDLLIAFAGLPVEIDNRPLHLVVAGDGPQMASLKRLEETLGLKGRITWTGWQNRPEIFFEMADIMVCPSRHEPLGNVILEAWAHGLPVVTTSTDGAMELVVDGHNGILSPLGNPRRLGEKILELLQAGHEEWHRIGSNGLRTLNANHSKASILKAYTELYDRLKKCG